MARIKKEEKKSVTVILILAGIMFFGTIAGGFLFGNPRATEERPTIVSPSQVTTEPIEKTLTIRHNPQNGTILTPRGYQTVNYNDTHIFVDKNNPLANKTLVFDITVVNMTKVNYTGDISAMIVEKRDAVVVDYTGSLGSGEIFDTSYADIAGDTSMPKVSWFRERPFYEPLDFIVGTGMMIEGFDEAVVGMKINETKTVELAPEKAYGLHDPAQVEVVPLTQNIQKTMEIRRFIEFTNEQFIRNFGNVNKTQGQTFSVPGTNFEASVFYTTENVTVIEMLLKMGAVVKIQDFPWNSTVVLINPGSIVLEHNIKRGDTLQFPEVPWNTTVL